MNTNNTYMPVNDAGSIDSERIAYATQPVASPYVVVAPIVAPVGAQADEVAEAKADVAKYGGRLGVSGKALVVFGVLMGLQSVWSAIQSRKIVEMILKKIHGGNDPDSDVMTRTEFALIDDFRLVSCCMLAMSAAMARMGGKTLCAVNKGSSSFADLVFRKNLFRIGLVIVTMYGIVFYGRECSVLFDSERAQARNDQQLDLGNQYERPEEVFPPRPPQPFDEDEEDFEEPELQVDPIEEMSEQRAILEELPHPEGEQIEADHSHWRVHIPAAGRNLKAMNSHHGDHEEHKGSWWRRSSEHQQTQSRHSPHDSKRHGRCPVPYIIFILIAFHTVTLHWFRTALHKLDSVDPKSAKKAKKTSCGSIMAMPAPVAPAAQYVDKQEYPVVQQPAQYFVATKNNMV